MNDYRGIYSETFRTVTRDVLRGDAATAARVATLLLDHPDPDVRARAADVLDALTKETTR